MKKSKHFCFLSSVFCLLGLTSLVRAGPIDGVRQLTYGLREIIEILFRFGFETILQINTVNEYLFYKLIIFTIILLIIYTTFKKTDMLGDKEPILWIISISIGILSVRFIPNELLEFIFFQYGTFGAAITIFFPFVIFLFFLHQSNIGPLPRKIGWIFFGVSYITIWAFRRTSISEISDYLYWGGILAIILAYLFDGYIHAKFGDIEIQQAKAQHDAARYTSIQARIKEMEDQLKDLSLPTHVRKQNEKTLKYLRKELHNINRRL